MGGHKKVGRQEKEEKVGREGLQEQGRSGNREAFESTGTHVVHVSTIHFFSSFTYYNY